MLLFLSLADSDKEAPNENYARELMELFTLGRGYSERDIRQASRALTGFRADWRDDGNAAHLLRRRVRTTRAAKRIFGRARALRLAGRAAALRAPPRPRAVPRRASSGTSSWARPPPAQGARAAGRDLPPLGPPHGAGGGARSWPTPRSTAELDAPGMVKAPVVFLAGALRSSGQGIDRRRLGLAAERHGPVPVPPAVGGGLGVGHRLAVDQLDARALRRGQLPARHAAPEGGGRLHPGRHLRRAARSRAPATRWATPGSPSAPSASCSRWPAAC